MKTLIATIIALTCSLAYAITATGYLVDQYETESVSGNIITVCVYDVYGKRGRIAHRGFIICPMSAEFY